MADLFVFDIYTAKTLGWIAAVLLVFGLAGYISRKSPKTSEFIGKMVIPLILLMALGFCTLSIAKTARMYDRVKDK